MTNKMKMKNNTSILISVLSLTIACVIAISLTIKSCHPAVNSERDRLEEINDSLMKEVIESSKKIDSLYTKIDSLNIVADTIINKQSIVNEYYRQEVYNILTADDRSANSKLTEVLKVSDSLLKTGFYSRTLNIPNESN